MRAHKWASVIKAWVDGETIQYKCLVSGEWVDFGGNDDPEPYEGPWRGPETPRTGY